jgi:hypothetical protein
MASEPRIMLSFRVAESGRDWLDDIVVEMPHEDVDRSDVIRAALILARRHQPELIETIREQL